MRTHHAATPDDPNPGGFSLRIPIGWNVSGDYVGSGGRRVLSGPEDANLSMTLLPLHNSLSFGWPSIYTIVPKGTVDVQFAGQSVSAQAFDLVSGPAEGQGPTTHELIATAIHRVAGVDKLIRLDCLSGYQGHSLDVCTSVIDSWQWTDGAFIGVRADRMYIRG